MLCHAAQNTVAMPGSRFGDPTKRGLAAEMIPMLVVTTRAFPGAIAVLQRTRIPVENV
jgi:hypothetical protein